MFRSFILFAAFCLINAPQGSIAQEAYIVQVGSQNDAANLDLTGESLAVIAQKGAHNKSVQLSAGGSNLLATAQIGDHNRSGTAVFGNQNFVATAQLGFANHASALVVGGNNSVSTVQVGFANGSDVALFGSNAQVNVEQTGALLHSSLVVTDQYGGPGGSTKSAGNSLHAGQSALSDGLSVGVVQGAGDAPVNAMVSRDSAGNIMIRPGSATTVLKLGN
ncbi:hypothetical protein IV417_10440 [Alphaproteobacteria bacterium KMM 3653]|uniref:Curlin associated repeat-containing protein n=1 Tax=Harenicola maris TaxID=2841044 RepID=A0AAP2G4E4_9RHOB|nr:hypothetical protein [Harenicola maris]